MSDGWRGWRGWHRNQRWMHAGKVALGATVIVGGVAVAVALVANLVITTHLSDSVDGRLHGQLEAIVHGAPAPVVTVSTNGFEGDLEDAPAFAWKVGSDGTATALTPYAPPLPVRSWGGGPVTLDASNCNFRLDAVHSGNGWLVVGESVNRIGQVRSDLLLAEALIGALLLVVTFGGSLLVGLRASAPIEQIRRRQAEFTADASHELRTPLSVIEAEVDLSLSRERDGDSYRSTLQRVASESGRLRSIVEDLLWLARADGAVRQEKTGQLTDVGVVGSSCVARFAAVADARSVRLVDRTGGGDGVPLGRSRGARLIEADPESVDRLASVLVDNACKFAGAGGTVEVSVTESGDRVMLTVDDSGPGIPEDEREGVFDRFHRTTDQAGGTGLGLAIADSVVRSTGGTWSIGTSRLGGARMSVSWNRAQRQGESPQNDVRT